MPPWCASGAGHQPPRVPIKIWERNYAVRCDRCYGGGSKGGGRFVDAESKQWDATAPRRGGEGPTDGACSKLKWFFLAQDRRNSKNVPWLVYRPCKLTQNTASCVALVEIHMMFGSYTATGGNGTGTGAHETAWRHSKPVPFATLSVPGRTLLGTTFVVQCITHNMRKHAH